jgi:hypothetical protein
MALRMSSIHRRNGCFMDSDEGKKSSDCMLWSWLARQKLAVEPDGQVLTAKV